MRICWLLAVATGMHKLRKADLRLCLLLRGGRELVRENWVNKSPLRMPMWSSLGDAVSLPCGDSRHLVVPWLVGTGGCAESFFFWVGHSICAGYGR